MSCTSRESRCYIRPMKVKNSLEALDVCNEEAFPNVYKLLNIMAALPVSTSTAERSFSSLNRLKTYLRSTMSEDRLNGLALLNIHRVVRIEAEDVVDDFFRVPRRISIKSSFFFCFP